MKWKGIGHTCLIQDPRLSKFVKKTGLASDPLANWDGARTWDLRRGFKRLLTPRPQLTFSDLSTANEIAYTWLTNPRAAWIPLQLNEQQIKPEKVKHYGLAFSYPQPSPDDMNYEVIITGYFQFRQFAWTGVNDPQTPNDIPPELPPNLELMNVTENDEDWTPSDFFE